MSLSIFISADQGKLIKSLICETYSSEIPLAMKSHVPQQLHFYLFFQEEHLWIKNIILSGSNIVNDSINRSLNVEDLYVVLDNCYNTHGIPGYQMRINLHNFLYEKDNSCRLCDDFLFNDATNNTNFHQSKTLNDLQSSTGFMLLQLLDTNDLNFSKMCPDIILPSVCLLYKTNIFFIDLDRNMSYLHLYNKNSSKIITYSFKDTIKCPSKMLKYNTFVKYEGYFKFIDNEAESHTEALNSSTYSLIFNNIQKSNTLSKHPQGRICITDSIPESLRQLLKSKNIDHEHFRNNTEQEDILDICDYMTELVSSFSDKALSFFFNSEIIQLLTAREVHSLTSLLKTLQSPLKQLPHEIVCPIMCLKYNLWISVWEDDVVMSKKSRTTYFYWYDYIKNMVICKVFHGNYIHLPCQSHILYIRFSKKSNIFGYWKQEEINPFTSQNPYIYSENLLCKYSYLDNPLESKVIQLFKNYFNMNIISEESPYCRINYHQGNNINPTLVPLLFGKDVSHSQKKGLLVIFPFNEKENMYAGYVIHNNVHEDVLHQKISFFNSKLDEEVLKPQFFFQNLSINLHLEFGSSFLLMIVMFIAHMSRNSQEIQCFLQNMKSEQDILNKSKRWLSDWLSDLCHNPQSTLIVPQWLQQLIGLNAPSKEYYQIQESIAEKKQKQSYCFGVTNHLKNILNTTTKRKLSKSPSNRKQKKSNQKQIQYRNSDFINNSNSQIIHPFFECSEVHNTESYAQFLAGVNFMAELEQKHQDQQKSQREKVPINNEKFVVAKLNSNPISAMNFRNLIDHEWICDEVIDFIGIMLMCDHENIHIFSTHFMPTMLNDISRVQTWYKNISSNINFLYIPIHKDGNHWLLSQVNFKEKEILLWNSSPDNVLNSTDNLFYLEKLRMYIEHMQNLINDDNARWNGDWIIRDESLNCPNQKNFDDCGIFTILNMVVLVNDLDLNANSYSQELINKFNTRERIGQIIHQASNNLLSSQVCLSAERDNDDNDNNNDNDGNDDNDDKDGNDDENNDVIVNSDDQDDSNDEENSNCKDIYFAN